MHTSLPNPAIHYVNDWKDLSNILHLDPEKIAFHINMVTRNGATVFEFMAMLETLIKFSTDSKSIYIGVGIDKDTPHKLIKDLRKTSVMGILPSTDFGINELDMAIEEMQKGHSYWPRHIIDQLPGAVVKVKHSTDEIKLTNRQTEIFNLVCKRGLSNKKIAQILNISESTVKVHISAILKAYRVRNRTQLALSGTEQGLRA
jgi:DNA-binding NarL/FixJ family response regulator